MLIIITINIMPDVNRQPDVLVVKTTRDFTDGLYRNRGKGISMNSLTRVYSWYSPASPQAGTRDESCLELDFLLTLRICLQV